ncbi:MAG: Hsp20/alpha crystallin family protein [Candidatus Zhuqueibacterota bacterium]
MKLMKWYPNRNLASLPDEVNDFFGNFGPDFWNTDRVWSPSVDITETKEGFEVRAEIPGLNKEDIKISFEENMLKLSGERKFEDEKREKDYHRIERRYGKFERAFYMPKNVKTGDIKASYKDGVLTVQIPKSEEAKAREIEIN